MAIMNRAQAIHRRTANDMVPFRFRDRLKEIDMFFQGKDPVHQTMRRLARRLQKAGIDYAIVGGMAVNAHRYRRTTGNVDFLMNGLGFAEFRRRFVDKNYVGVRGRPLRFRDRVSGITIDILVTGLFPGSGEPGPIAYPEPEKVSETIDTYQVVDLKTLVELKLAAPALSGFWRCRGANSVQSFGGIFWSPLASVGPRRLHRMFEGETARGPL